MTVEMMGLEAELAYRRDRLLAEAEADRQARAVRGATALDRMVERLRGRRRRVVAASGTARLHTSWR